MHISQTQNTFYFFSKRRGRGYLKSTCLVSPKENWPPIGKLGIDYSVHTLAMSLSEHVYTWIQAKWWVAVRCTVVRAVARIR
jgi:hypothetical protein